MNKVGNTSLVLFLTIILALGCFNVAVSASNMPTDTFPLSLGVPFHDHAVLQQQMPIPIWGKARPGATLTVHFAGKAYQTEADQAGSWRVTLDSMTAEKLQSVNDVPQGHTMHIVSILDGKQITKELKDLVIGDIWVFAGQSNMAGSMKRAGHVKNYPPNSIHDANYPALRHLIVDKGEWQICSPETASAISRVTFFVARRLQQDLLIPIGVTTRAVGGSNIESWLNQDPYQTGKHYKNLVSPIVGYGIKGMIWYQGESNERDKRGYQPKLESLITGWRKAWGQGDFPAYFVQLPGQGAPNPDDPAGGDGRAEIRQAFMDTLSLKNTGMAVTIDIGTPGEHPPNKYDTGIRLARSVLKRVYGMDITESPLYKSHQIEGNTIRISFTEDADQGLMIAKKADPGSLPESFQPPVPTPDTQIDWLSIQGKDGSWHWANGVIEGAELVVSSDAVEEPIAVRYAYTGQPYGHLLYNKDGMPVGPFSTCGYDPLTPQE
jgi:sialate O-acetylesterase